MAKIHFLNVGNGDCHIIEHETGNVTVIDVNKAGTLEESKRSILGNFNQKDSPTDPIIYLQELNKNSIFRFILTHPDMDHLGGIKKFFDKFSVLNFWDSENDKSFNDSDWEACPYNKEDWDFYQKLKNNKVEGTSRKTFYAAQTGKYFNEDDNGGKGDCLKILAPTKDIVKEANAYENWNDLSYVLLFENKGFKILFAGDSDDTSWDYILNAFPDLVKDIDILIAPHHGRDSGRKWDFLDVLKPRLSLVGNANSEHLAYSRYSKYGPLITNNQAGDVIIDTYDGWLNVYVKNEKYAAKFEDSYYSSERDAYSIGYLGKNITKLKKKEDDASETAARLKSILGEYGSLRS